MSSDACPSEDTIAGFIQGQLSRATAADVERHIDRCAGCTELLVHLGRAFAVPSPLQSPPAAGSKPLGERGSRVPDRNRLGVPSHWLLSLGWMVVQLGACVVLWLSLEAYLGEHCTSVPCGAFGSPISWLQQLVWLYVVYLLLWAPAGALHAALRFVPPVQGGRAETGARKLLELEHRTLAYLHAAFSLPALVASPLAAYELRQRRCQAAPSRHSTDLRTTVAFLGGIQAVLVGYVLIDKYCFDGIFLENAPTWARVYVPAWAALGSLGIASTWFDSGRSRHAPRRSPQRQSPQRQSPMAGSARHDSASLGKVHAGRVARAAIGVVAVLMFPVAPILSVVLLSDVRKKKQRLHA